MFSNDSAEIGIRYLALAPLLSGIRELSTIALWGTGDKNTPLVGLIIGAVCSVALNYYLIAIPGFTYAGAAIGILSLELIAALWNMNALRTYTKRFLTGLSSSTIVIILLFAASFLLAKLASHAFHLPHYVQSIGEMTLINGCMILYIIMRILKKERR
jgi:stage V sporulation protein B